ncbi:MAG: site-specific integrase, partial [Actinomycetota bacterium]|nr:site-specific integrase [Actinomycetota bacterium]
PDQWTMHSLRHRFASRAYAVDRDVLTVQDLLGHASPATTQRYVQLPDDAKRRLIEAVAGPDRVSAFRSGAGSGRREVTRVDQPSNRTAG